MKDYFMKKTKFIAMIAIASSTLLFSGCVHRTEPFPVDKTYNNSLHDYDTSPRVGTTLLSYAYPYFYDRPFYYLDGRYYYGGFFRDGFYHYGDRIFRHGHYYSRGYRYYNGRRYRAINRQHGYYINRDAYIHSNNYRNRDRERSRRFDRGREYRSREYRRRDGYSNNSWDNNMRRKTTHVGKIVKNAPKQYVSKHQVSRTVRQRPR